ncbi:hypothetical protein TNCV_5045951 [Trichonephila clavipes]|uniref:Uncharacterized protein n=1 Tax=Trichonephila clavipes TaxID=2585209 RepID=A0A8X7BKF1_TRICX|nr:hypothetical protein TNCV_5045951 [Trichonephila clavipes]
MCPVGCPQCPSDTTIYGPPNGIRARAMKVARFSETFPQAELRRFEQVERDAAHRAAETPERSQARRRRQAEYLASQRAAETPEQSQARRL